MNGSVFTQWSLDELFQKAQSRQPFKLPEDFEQTAQEYVSAMWHWPERTFEISNINKRKAIEETEFKIRYILEGKP